MTPPTAEDLERAAALEAGAKKMSKVFSAMKAEDAANILEKLSDEEIEAILLQMSERTAAPILEAFDPARAAALSRLVLNSGRPGS